MQTFLTLTTLLAAALAAPTKRSLYDINLVLHNDFTGRSSLRAVASGDYANPIPLNWETDTAFLTDGHVKASSMTLQGVTSGENVRVECTVSSNGQSFTLNTDTDWVTFRGIGDAQGLADFSASEATVACLAGEELEGPAKLHKRSEFDVEIKLTNDFTGASATARTPSGGAVLPISALFSGSVLQGEDGLIKASSVEFITTYPNAGTGIVSCGLAAEATSVTVGTQRTFADLDPKVAAGLIDVTEANLACYVFVDGESV
jgi:hypothetical protein